jgi:hypothetical protein
MARQPRDPRQRPDRPGERPLLQGHLRAGGKSAVVQRPTTDSPESTEAPSAQVDDVPSAPADEAPSAQVDDVPSAQPAREGTAGEADAERGKATRSPVETATRRHLEGSEQGPT